MELTRDDVETGFREVGEILHRARKVAEIAVHGGVAVMLQLDAAFRTRDVNAVVEAGDHGAFEAAVAEVARRRGWRRSWVSEAVSVYLGARADLSLHGTYPSEGRPGLRVYVAPPDYLLAMKLRAMRAATRDEEDARALARSTGIRTADALMALLRRHFPGEEPEPRRAAIVAAFADGLGDDATP